MEHDGSAIPVHGDGADEGFARGIGIPAHGGARAGRHHRARAAAGRALQRGVILDDVLLGKRGSSWTSHVPVSQHARGEARRHGPVANRIGAVSRHVAIASLGCRQLVGVWADHLGARSALWRQWRGQIARRSGYADRAPERRARGTGESRRPRGHSARAGPAGAIHHRERPLRAGTRLRHTAHA